MILAIEKAIYAALAAGTAGTLVSDRIYNGLAPVDAVMPFIVFAFDSGGERSIANRAVIDVRYSVKAVGLDPAAIKPVAPAIRADLHEKPLTLDSPYTLIRIQHIAWIDSSELIERQLYFYAGGYYRFRLTEAL
jgi:hypothetical protein